MVKDYSHIKQQEYLHHGHTLRDWNYSIDFKPGASHLDVGCGTGAYLLFKSKAHYKVGIDLDEKALKYAPNNLETHFISLDDFHKQNRKRKFNYLSAFEVVEHVEDPSNFFETCFEMLEPMGTIFGSTPNKERLWLKYFPKEPFDYPPNHLNYFSAEDIIILLENANFTDIKIYPAFRFPSYGSLIYRVNIITNKKLYKLLLLLPTYMFILYGNFRYKRWLHHGFSAKKN